MPLLIRVLIGSLVSSIKVSLVRFTRKRFTIYKPNVSLEDRQADVSRGQGLFAFSIYTAYYRLLTATSISRKLSSKVEFYSNVAAVTSESRQSLPSIISESR